LAIFETSAVLAGCPPVLAVTIALDRCLYLSGKQNYIPVMIIALAASLVLRLRLLALMAVGYTEAAALISPASAW
jgi:hypothetical protein